MNMDSTWDNDEVDILKGETQTKKWDLLRSYLWRLVFKMKKDTYDLLSFFKGDKKALT